MSNNDKLLNESYEASLASHKEGTALMEKAFKKAQEDEKIKILREYAKAALTGFLAGKNNSTYASYDSPESYAVSSWRMAELMYNEEQRRR